MAEAENLFAEAIGDERVKKFNNRAREAKFAVDKTLNREIQKFIIFAQTNRKPFEPNSAEDLKGLIASMEETQAYRDRLTGILIQSSIIIDELQILLKSGEAYLFTEYTDTMKKCSNKETREAAIRYVFAPVFRAVEQWKSLRSIAETAKINLNDTYFALREIGENGRTILAARNVRRSFDGA